MEDNNFIFYVGRTKGEAFDNGQYESYEEALDCQTEYNLHALAVGKLPCSIFEVKITWNDLVKIA